MTSLSRTIFYAAIAALCFAACGSESSGSSGVDGGVGADAATSSDGGSKSDAAAPQDASGDASGCVDSPKVGEACTPGQKSCDRIDPCCAQETVCDDATKKWKDSGVACLLCNGFPCGNQTCDGGAVCLARGSGIDGGSTAYECVSMPPSCARNWSCSCVTSNPPPGCTLTVGKTCNEDGVHVTLTCMGQ